MEEMKFIRKIGTYGESMGVSIPAEAKLYGYKKGDYVEIKMKIISPYWVFASQPYGFEMLNNAVSAAMI